MSKWTAHQIPDLTGKVAIVTGANSGIGLETTRELARNGAKVVMACRNPAKAETALADIRNSLEGADVSVIPLDLASLESVRTFANEFNESHDRLDLLCNNAGIMMVPFGKTEDGFERQIGTNHLGHFALTGLLLPKLISTPGSRVVNVSSLAHKQGKIDFDNLQGEKKYGKISAYCRSKLANLLFTYELQRRFDGANVDAKSVAAHPGWTGTNLQNDVGWIRFLNPLMAMKPSQGALPTLFAATVDVDGGTYYGPSGIGEVKGYPKQVKSTPLSHDQAVAKQLWEVSEQLTDVRFTALAN